MNIIIDKNEINKYDFFDMLHDKLIGEFNIINDNLEFDILNNSFDRKPLFHVTSYFGKNPTNYINVNFYKIKKGKIKGKLKDIYNVIKNNIEFSLIDVGYMNSSLFFKGSIIKNNRLNRSNILIEFCFEHSNFKIEIKSI